MGIMRNELIEVTEEDFDNIVIKYRSLYTMKYDGNAQNFYINGKLEARREIN